MNHPTVGLCADRETLAAGVATIQPTEHNTSGWLVAVRFGGVTIQTYGDATPEDLASTLDYLAGQVRRLAANAQTERLPGCDGGDLPAPERQPRERGTRCQKCGRDTWTVDAICSRCADRHCQHCADPVLSVEGGLIHTTNGTVYCDEPTAGPTTEAA